MDSKELKGLMEAYSEVYAPQEEIEEASYSAKAARAGKDIGKPGKAFAKIAASAGKRYGSKERGEKVAGAVLAKLRKQHEEVEIDEAVRGASPHAMQMRKDAASERKAGAKDRLSPSEGKANAAKMQRDIKFYDKITKKTKPSVVGMTHEEVGQIDEISQKTATRAFAQRATDDYELDNTARTKSGESKADETKRRIEKKFGKGAGQHAERAAHANTFGRGKEGFTKMPPKPTNEELDVFDVVLEFLQVEGYAETLEEAEWLMANVIDDEAIGIILGEAQEARNNPEKYEREQAKKTSKREKAMNDPHTGINSPAFAEFMRKQMGR